MDDDPKTAGYQSWRCLTFLHWRVPAGQLQALVPQGLTIEQFDGSAWLGLVPFSMERIRPWWCCAVPGISWFLETNVRTYVTDERGRRGVWFFSLDANQRLAVWIAKTFWHLPYKYGRMSLDPDIRAGHTQPTAAMADAATLASAGRSMRVEYTGRRRDAPFAEYRIAVRPKPTAPTPAAPGTLDEFLVERYLLFAADSQGRMRSGRVHHAPYLTVPVEHCEISESLTRAMECPIEAGRPPDHAAWSPGVDVRVSPLRICG
jgi:uncharacterized protein